MADLVYLTPAEAADLCRYSRPDSFLRAFRTAGFEVFGRPGKLLIKSADLETFLQLNPPLQNTVEHT